MKFGILVLKGISAVILGNVLCAVMTVGIYVFGSNTVIKILAVLCGVLIFQSLIFTFGWNEGKREIKSPKKQTHRKKYRCLAAGMIIFLVAAAPSVALLLNKLLFPEQDLLILYQFVSGSAYPFVQAFVPLVETELAWESSNALRIDGISVLFPILMCAYYLLIPVSAQLGFRCGYSNTFGSDKIIYK